MGLHAKNRLTVRKRTSSTIREKNAVSRTANLLTGRKTVIGVLYSFLRQAFHHRQHRFASSGKALESNGSRFAETWFADFALDQGSQKPLLFLLHMADCRLPVDSEASVADSESFDLVIVGCGPAGEKAGAQAAYFGKRVA